MASRGDVHGIDPDFPAVRSLDNRMTFRRIFLLLILQLASCAENSRPTVVIVSANAEWRSLIGILKPDEASIRPSPYGQWFVLPASSLPGLTKPITFFHGGWGKIDAAASAQWVVSAFRPRLVVNLGTAGGFPGRVKEGEIVFATRTLVYDIVERMGSAAEALNDYTTELAPPPESLIGLVVPSTILSADQDIDPQGIHKLMQSYDAVAADWESASIARVCKKNAVPVIILRGISDVVHPSGSRAYGNPQDFEAQTQTLMRRLLALLAKVA